MIFDFTKQNGEKYLEKIENEDVRRLVANFFSPPTIDIVSKRDLLQLVDAINNDIKNSVFDVYGHNRLSKSVVAFNTMREEQLNSNTHVLFLNIIKKNFGSSAYNLLKQRKNINVFNVSEINVLHQDIFDNFGEAFVNRILNNDLTPQSLIIIKNILSDPKEMKNFKFYYKFYAENIGSGQADFERMIRGYDNYKSLIDDIVTKKIKLSDAQKKHLVDILVEKKNIYGIYDVEAMDSYDDEVQKLYDVEKNVAKIRFDSGNTRESLLTLANAFFRRNFGVPFAEINPFDMNRIKFNPNERSAFALFRFFDLNDVINGEMGKNFTAQEIDFIKDIYDIASSVMENKEDAFDELMRYCEKYEKMNVNVRGITIKLFDKLPRVYEKELVSTLSKVEDIEKRASSEEDGIYKDENPMTRSGEPVDLPVYVFDGADFAFLSFTGTKGQGLSGNVLNGDIATSWFEYENGTPHICCSYANQDKLSNLEFNRSYYPDPITYFFDDATLYSMGPDDIFSPESPRVSSVVTNEDTKFLSPSKFIESSKAGSYNEVDISRYNYEGEISYGGKIIPSGILCCEYISDSQLEAARSFTKYCVEKGLKPQGWQLPIVVVSKQRYREIRNMKRKGLISKNSEYFTRNHAKQNENVETREQSSSQIAMDIKVIDKNVSAKR